MFISKKKYDELKRKNKELKEEHKYAVDDRDHYKKMSETWENNYLKANSATEEQKRKVEELQKKNEELQHRIDILYAYYNVNGEPTQDERTKIRIDLRVHELEMENLELKAAVNAQIGYLRNELNRERLRGLNSIYQVPWPYCNAQAANLIHC